MWCLAHRLELSIKDALSNISFDLHDELYYVYEKSPKKCKELETIISDLKECFQFDDDGVRPVRACGTRWVSHKVNAMKWILSKLGLTWHTLRPSSKTQGVSPKWVDVLDVVYSPTFSHPVLCSPSRCRRMTWTFLEHLPACLELSRRQTNSVLSL